MNEKRWLKYTETMKEKERWLKFTVPMKEKDVVKVPKQLSMVRSEMIKDPRQL
jgi:hypothetical protein